MSEACSNAALNLCFSSSGLGSFAKPLVVLLAEDVYNSCDVRHSRDLQHQQVTGLVTKTPAISVTVSIVRACNIKKDDSYNDGDLGAQKISRCIRP